MIAIVNTGENPEPTGVHSYRIYINDQFIAEFTHVREKGLGKCLREAAKAADEALIREVLALFDPYEDTKNSGQEGL